MKAKFIETNVGTARLGIEFTPETNEERLLLNVLSQQLQPYCLMRLFGWGFGGNDPGCTYVRMCAAKPEEFAKEEIKTE